MKKIIIALSAVILFAKCTEQNPIGLQLTNPISFNDSTYDVSPVPTAQAKNILVEEFTGVKCANCPTGAAIIRAMQNANPNRIIVAKMHSNFLADPIKTTDVDLRTQDAEDIDLGFGGAPSKPSAIIDRIINTNITPNNIFFNDKDKWAAAINAQLAKTSPINLQVICQLDTFTNKINIKGIITFTETNADTLAMSIYITQNKIVATQDSASATGSPIEIDDYEHEEALRKCVTPVITGTTFKTAAVPAGRVFEKGASVDIPLMLTNINNTHVVVFIHKINKGEVLQATEAKITFK
jgi:hypothetical protein